MCGIVGYVGKDRAASILLEGLKRLEYRGYDSAGLAIHDGTSLQLIKKTGRVQVLEQSVAGRQLRGRTGISHTRWATHGGVTDANAHPHLSSDGHIALVHNGVVENHAAIKDFLLDRGFTFSSETDTEVLANLIAYHYGKEPDNGNGSRLFEAVRKTLRHVEGTYGLAVMARLHSNEIIGARSGSPLILGLGEEENLLASDVAALVGRTRNVVYLKDGEIVRIKANDFSISNISREEVDPVVDRIDWKIEDADLGRFRHHMEKEIFEQPEALRNTMRGRFAQDGSTALFGGLNTTPAELRQVDRLLFCGCGTAWHSCLVARYLIERFARIPVDVEYASEFRYRNAPLAKNTLVFVVSQSGETIDTLAALREAQRKGYRCLAIVNVVGSTIARESDGGIYQHAGPEIGVASTKAFTSQILLAAMIALYLGRMRDLSFQDGIAFVEALQEVPALVGKILQQADTIRDIARKYSHSNDFLFLGRQAMFPIALEGALKLKEISYIHAEGYPAAELKHGPLALISPDCPSLFLVPRSETFAKVVSNMQEVKARQGPILAIGTEECKFPAGLVDDLITIPDCHEAIQPILASIPVQLLSYYMAVARGCDVDKPRNLAKSVTVE